MTESTHARPGHPIVILGAARSGTTLLAETILARHPDIAYWSEPNHVWRYGHAYRRSDVLRESDATPSVVRFIEGEFARFLAKSGRTRFMEKTPQNCLRMSFVRRVLPDALVVHVLRDGRDVALSAAREWRGRGRGALDSREARSASLPRRLWMLSRRWARLGERVRDLRGLLELPATAPRFVSFVLRQSLHVDRLPWGPRLPGLAAIRSAYPLLETCALQWDACVRAARSGCLSMPPERYLEVRYETLIRAPRDETARILEFLGLDRSGTRIDDMTAGVASRPDRDWRVRMSGDEVRRVEAVIGSTLQDLGYPLASSEAPTPSETTTEPAR